MVTGSSQAYDMLYLYAEGLLFNSQLTCRTKKIIKMLRAFLREPAVSGGIDW